MIRNDELMVNKYYQKCAVRERNKGLYLSDQFNNNELVAKTTAIYTRQVFLKGIITKENIF